MEPASAEPDIDLLPGPLARVYEALRNTGMDARSRHAAAFASLEAIVRWQGLLLLTARSRMKLPVDRLKRVQNFLKRPSFGFWVEVLLRHGSREQERLSTGIGSSGLLEDLRQMLTAPRLEYGQLVKEVAGRGSGRALPWKDTIEHLPPYRNDFIGHAGFLSDDHYEKTAPLFEAATNALLEQLGQMEQELRVHSLTEEGVILQLQGLEDASPTAGVPPVSVAPGDCYISRPDGSLLIELGELLHFDDGIAYLFDRTPRERRTEFIDFASGKRTRRDGTALLDSTFTESLSIEAAEGSSAEVVTGRMAIRGHTLRDNIAMGERLWIRVVLGNRSPVAMRCSVQLPECLGWRWSAETVPDTKDVAAGEHQVWLLAAEPLHTGTIAPPIVEIVSSFDTRLLTVEPEGPIRIRDADRLPLVGREKLLSRVMAHLDPQERPGATTLIGGAEGQRTGALLAELARQVRHQGVRDVTGTFRGAAGQPFKGFQDLLRELLGVSLLESDGRDLHEGAAQTLEELLGEDAAAIAFFLDELTGEGSLEKTSDQMRSFWWFRLLTSAAREAPLFIGIDDLEKADADSARLLTGLIARCVQERVPVLFVACTEGGENTRTDRPAGWGSEVPLQIVDVEPIGREAIEEMLDLAYPSAPFRDDIPWLAEALTERAAGNIGFAIDLVRTLGPTGSSIFAPLSEGRWQIAGDPPRREEFSEKLPARRSDLFAESIARFSEKQAEILETAALIEGDISVEVLERIYEDADLLDDALDRFETDGLGEAVDTDLTLYRFRTESARVAVIAAFEARGRRAAQRRRRQLAKVLIELQGDQPERSGAIGRLLLEAGQGIQAVEFLLPALVRRLDQGRYVEGHELVESIDRAINDGALLSLEDQGRYLLSAARVLVNLGNQEAAEKFLSKIDEGSEDEVYLQRQILQSEISDRKGYAEDSIQILEDLRESVEKSGTSQIAQKFQINLGMGFAKLGRFDEAVEEYLKGLRFAEERGDELGQAGLLNNLGNVRLRIREFDAARENFSRSVEIFHRLGHLDRETITRVGLASIDFYQGHLEEAGRIYRDAIATFRLIQNRMGLGRNYRNLGEVERLLGRFDIA
ncbi:MAG: tetratricopeptide repeat protein, partial [Planctomycetota bacterium]